MTRRERVRVASLWTAKRKVGAMFREAYQPPPLYPSLRRTKINFAWVCPLCGRENWEVEEAILTSAPEGATLRFFRDAWGWQVEPAPSKRTKVCPHCRRPLREEDIERGFYRWLHRLARRNIRAFSYLAALLTREEREALRRRASEGLYAKVLAAALKET
jgi:hypothetical protein